METVTRLRAGTTTDEYGDTVIDWSAPDSVSYYARGIEPVSSEEETRDRQATITGYRVYLEAGADVLAGDRMVLRGDTYDVDGLPADWRSPFGSAVGGLVVALTGASV